MEQNTRGSPTKEELLEKARRNYPKGTKFKSASGNNDILTSYGEFYIDGTVLWNGKEGGGHGWICDIREGLWAEIIELPKPKEVYFNIFNWYF